MLIDTGIYWAEARATAAWSSMYRISPTTKKLSNHQVLMVLGLMNVVMNNHNYPQTVEENSLIHGANGRGGNDVDANSYDNDSDDDGSGDDGDDIDYAVADNSYNVNNGDGHSSVDGDDVD